MEGEKSSAAAAAKVASVVTDSVQPHRRQPRIKDWRNYSGEEGGVKVPSKEETLGSGSKSKDVQKF